jgi:hypothetical protein
MRRCRTGSSRSSGAILTGRPKRKAPAHKIRRSALPPTSPIGQSERVMSPDLDLTEERRERVVRSMIVALEAAIDGSTFLLRGSLADGTADRYSDIDAVWIVPDGCLPGAVDRVSATLDTVRRVASARVDHSESRERQRLVLVTFADLPVFWRFDLAIQEVSGPGALIGRGPAPSEWSLPESALANAVAAIKALARGKTSVARGLLERGYQRVGETYERGASWRTDVARLAQLAGHADPSIAARADKVRRVAEALLME